jgi:hypothetical protein
MVANVDNIRTTFIMCNNAYFKRQLPEPCFELMHSYKYCALFHYNYDIFGGCKFKDPIIRVTDYYDFADSMFVDLICHEMIHYYLAYYGIDRKVKHGQDFLNMANFLNQNYGLNIVVEYDKSTLIRSDGAPLLKYWLNQLF